MLIDQLAAVERASAPTPRGQASQEDIDKQDDAAARLKAEKDANEARKQAEQEAAVKLKEANEAAKLKAEEEAKEKSEQDAAAKLEAEREAASLTEISSETSNKSEATVVDIHIFRKVAEAVDTPIILYNVPGRTVADLANNTVIKLAEIPNIIGIKDATGDILRGQHLVKNLPEDFQFIVVMTQLLQL